MVSTLKLQIFANTFPVHYSAPNGFNFEVNNPDVDVGPVQVLTFNNQNADVILHILLCIWLIAHLQLYMQDDPLIFDYNVKQRVKEFIDAATTQVSPFYSTIFL